MRSADLPLALGLILIGALFGAVAVLGVSTLTNPRALRDAEIRDTSPEGRAFSETDAFGRRRGRRVTDPVEKGAVLVGMTVMAGLFSLISIGAGLSHLADALHTHPPDDDEKAGRPYVAVSPSLWRHRGLRLLLVSPACPSPPAARRSAGSWAAFTAAYHLAGIPLLLVWHAPWIVVVGFALGGAMLLGGTFPRVRYYLADRKVAFQIEAWTREARPGERVELRCWLTARRPVHLRNVRLSLACFEHVPTAGRIRTRLLAFRESPIAEGQGLRAGETIALAGAMPLPDDAAPSVRGVERRITWTLGVVVDLPAWPDLEEIREVFVRPPASVREGTGGKPVDA